MTPREVLDEMYNNPIVTKYVSNGQEFWLSRPNLDQALSDLSEIVMRLEKSGYSDEYFSWNAGYNIALEDIAKLFTDKEEK